MSEPVTSPARATGSDACVLCEQDGGVLLWRDDVLRVIAADEAAYPGFCRVIWNAHVAEFSQLDAAQQAHLMQVVSTVEQVMRAVMQPDKINLAALGNMVPHLHWHVIARYTDDAHFPAPIWAAPVRDVAPDVLARRAALAATLHRTLAATLQALPCPGAAASAHPGAQ